MNQSLSHLASPVSSLLFALGADPNHQIFWILYHIADIQSARPLGVLELHSRLFPLVGERCGISAAGVDSSLRIFAKHLPPLLAVYLPAGSDQPPNVAQVVSAWLRLCGEYELALAREKVKDPPCVQ